MSEAKSLQNRDALLKIDRVTMQFGGLKAVCDFDLSIAKGELVGLIGPNGAGKTTVFNVITGVYTPTQGSIAFEGRTISGMNSHRIACGGITRTFQNIRLFTRLSCLDNVCVATHPHRKAGIAAAILRTAAFQKDEKALKHEAMEMLEVLGLAEHANEPATSLA
jgi:branched-chain amino acid transport system ATP-binding protein